MWQSPCGAGSLQGKEVSGIIDGQKTQQNAWEGCSPLQGEKKQPRKVELSSSVMKIKILRQPRSESVCTSSSF